MENGVKKEWGYYIKEIRLDDLSETGFRILENYDDNWKLDKAVNNYLYKLQKSIDNPDSYLNFKSVTDGVDGLFEGQMETVSFYGGHGKEYYWGKNVESNFFDELFANCMELDITKDEELIKITNELYPNSRKLYEEIRDKIMKKAGVL